MYTTHLFIWYYYFILERLMEKETEQKEKLLISITMSDANDRRKRILENSQKRFERLQRLKRAEHPDNQQQELQSSNSREEVLPNTRQPECVEASQEIDNNSQTNLERYDTHPSVVSSTSNVLEESSEFSLNNEAAPTKIENVVRARKALHISSDGDAKQQKNSQTSTQETIDKAKPKTSESSSTTDESLPSSIEQQDVTTDNKTTFGWFVRKRRFIVFVLLSLLCYCITYKGLDVLLASLSNGRNIWKSSDTFVKLFSAVELQMILMDLFGGRQGGDTQLPLVLSIVLNGLGVPKSSINFASRLMVVVSSALTDFCVYFFVYVVLVQVKV